MINAIKVLLQRQSGFLQQRFFNIFKLNKGTKRLENHSLD
jgi:hypothetical protein